MNEVVDIIGKIEKKEIRQTKKGDDYFIFKIEGANWNWFTNRDPQGAEIARVLNEGDEVTGLGEKTEREDNSEPYRNIKSLQRTGTPVEKVSTNPFDKPEAHLESLPQTKVTDYKTKEADIYELGMAKNNAMAYLIKFSNERFTPQTWTETVNLLFEEGKRLRKEKLGY